MAGGEWHIKLGFSNAEKLLVILLGMPLSCSALAAETGTDMPSVELLEFLGRWETRAGDWMNPNIFADGEFGAILDGAPINSDDNVTIDDSTNGDNDSGGANGNDNDNDADNASSKVGANNDNSVNSDSSNTVNGADND